MKKEIVKTLGKNIRYWRKKRGFSQEKLAELANCHHNHISFIERGERAATVVKVVYIAKALKCNLTDLFKGLM